MKYLISIAVGIAVVVLVSMLIWFGAGTTPVSDTQQAKTTTTTTAEIKPPATVTDKVTTPPLVVENPDGTTTKVNADEYDKRAEKIRLEERAADKAESDRKLAEQAAAYEKKLADQAASTEAALTEQRKLIATMLTRKYEVDPNSAGASRRTSQNEVPTPQVAESTPTPPAAVPQAPAQEKPKDEERAPVVQYPPPPMPLNTAPAPVASNFDTPLPPPAPVRHARTSHAMSQAQAAVPVNRGINRAQLAQLAEWDALAVPAKVKLIKQIRAAHCKHAPLPEGFSEEQAADYIAKTQSRAEVIEGLERKCGIRVSERSLEDDEPLPRQVALAYGPDSCSSLPGTHWSKVVQSCVPNR